MDKYKKIIGLSKQALVMIEDVINIFVAIILAIVAVLIGIKIFTVDFQANAKGIIELINDAMLILIIKELLWTVIRFLGRHRFHIESYLFVGMIAAVRKILSLEANSTFSGKHLEITQMYEMGMMVVVIFVLALSYFFIKKAEQCVNDEDFE